MKTKRNEKYREQAQRGTTLNYLRPLSSESSSELKVLRLDSYSLGVDSGEIGWMSISVTSS